MADKNMRILIVDDFSTMRRMVRNMLAEIGFENTVEAQDGAIGWEVLKQEKIDLVICDWNMPNVEGIELLRMVRADADLKETPFVMVTAEGNKDNVVSAVQEGVSGYILKPFAAQKLEEQITSLFG